MIRFCAVAIYFSGKFCLHKRDGEHDHRRIEMRSGRVGTGVKIKLRKF